MYDVIASTEGVVKEVAKILRTDRVYSVCLDYSGEVVIIGGRDKKARRAGVRGRFSVVGWDCRVRLGRDGVVMDSD